MCSGPILKYSILFVWGLVVLEILVGQVSLREYNEVWNLGIKLKYWNVELWHELCSSSPTAQVTQNFNLTINSFQLLCHDTLLRNQDLNLYW
jgi:hypothetical protein